MGVVIVMGFYVQQYTTFYYTVGVSQKLCTAVHYILLHYGSNSKIMYSSTVHFITQWE